MNGRWLTDIRSQRDDVALLLFQIRSDTERGA